MTNVTTATTTTVATTIEQLLPISAQKFDVRLSSKGGRLLVFREDTNTCIVDVQLKPEEIAQIKEVVSAK